MYVVWRLHNSSEVSLGLFLVGWAKCFSLLLFGSCFLIPKRYLRQSYHVHLCLSLVLHIAMFLFLSSLNATFWSPLQAFSFNADLFTTNCVVLLITASWEDDSVFSLESLSILNVKLLGHDLHDFSIFKIPRVQEINARLKCCFRKIQQCCPKWMRSCVTGKRRLR